MKNGKGREKIRDLRRNLKWSFIRRVSCQIHNNPIVSGALIYFYRETTKENGQFISREK